MTQKILTKPIHPDALLIGDHTYHEGSTTPVKAVMKIVNYDPLWTLVYFHDGDRRQYINGEPAHLVVPTRGR